MIEFLRHWYTARCAVPLCQQQVFRPIHRVGHHHYHEFKDAS